jgi:phage recombination protein Bet
MSNEVAMIKPQPSSKTSVLMRLGEKFGIDPDKMLVTLKATAFRGDVNNEQMMALLVVADAYNLNPWTKEIYAFPDRNNGIVPVVGVDGWSRIINSNKEFDGMEFTDGPLNGKQIPEWIECKIFRKDRAHPISVREYFAEVGRDVGPWKSHPRRMLRHKAMIQCSRLAFGFVGVYDPDEAEQIVDATPKRSDTTLYDNNLDTTIRDKHCAELRAIMDQDKEEKTISIDLNTYVNEALMQFPEMYQAVLHKLRDDKVISIAKFKEYLRLADSKFVETTGERA